MREQAVKRAIGVAVLLSVCSSVVMGRSPVKIAPIGDKPKGFSRVFSKQVDVFGVKVFATRRTPDAKVLHAASVLAQYLDNDADGCLECLDGIVEVSHRLAVERRGARGGQRRERNRAGGTHCSSIHTVIAPGSRFAQA